VNGDIPALRISAIRLFWRFKFTSFLAPTADRTIPCVCAFLQRKTQETYEMHMWMFSMLSRDSEPAASQPTLSCHA